MGSWSLWHVTQFLVSEVLRSLMRGLPRRSLCFPCDILFGRANQDVDLVVASSLIDFGERCETLCLRFAFKAKRDGCHQRNVSC